MNNLINKFLIMLAVIVSFTIVCQAQTTLSAGDIAIVGFNSVANDNFAFVFLVPISTGTVIRFTDAGWLSSGGFRSDEGAHTFTAASDYNAGDVIIYPIHGIGDEWAKYIVPPFWQGAGRFTLNEGGDQLIAFQGSATSPVIINAVNFNVEGTAGVWQANATTTLNSAFPLFDLGAAVPYDFPTYTNADFKIRFRTVVGVRQWYRNDVAIDEVRIYSDGAEYDDLYSMNDSTDAANGFDFVGPDFNDLWDNADKRGAWNWTSTSTPTNDNGQGTGPPTGIACVYTETSSPVTGGDIFTMTLTDAVDASAGVHVTFDFSIYGHSDGHLYFEAWDGSTWNIIDDWDLNTFAMFIPSGKFAAAMAVDPELNNYYYSGGANSDMDALRTAIEDNSNWTGNDINRYDFATIFTGPLPVELTSFSAVIKDKSVDLNWKTETEVNNYGFEIQRSLHQDKWNVLGFVEGHGNSNSPKEYNFIDSEVNSSGTYSYRLKQIDNDGTYEFSKTVKVDFTAPISFQLNQNYPNPFNPSTTISFNLPESGKVILKIYNIMGEEIKTLVEGFMDAGFHKVNFNAEGYPSGMYLYILNTNGFTTTKKMLLMK